MMQHTPSEATAHLKESIANSTESPYRSSHPLVFSERVALFGEAVVVALVSFAEAIPALAPPCLLREREEHYPDIIRLDLSTVVQHGVPIDRSPLYPHQEETPFTSFSHASNLRAPTDTGVDKTGAFACKLADGGKLRQTLGGTVNANLVEAEVVEVRDLRAIKLLKAFGPAPVAVPIKGSVDMRQANA